MRKFSGPVTRLRARSRVGAALPPATQELGFRLVQARRPAARRYTYTVIDQNQRSSALACRSSYSRAPRPGHSQRSHNQATPDKRAMRGRFGVT
jgi:hypothetical protein